MGEGEFHEARSPIPALEHRAVQTEGFVVIRSRAAHESDYQAALRVATYLMGRGPEQGTSG
jgi:hypothetical protein